MNLPRLAVERPITTAMLLISVLVMGGIALARIPLAYLPEIDVPFIMVQVPYPDSNPTQVEKEVTKPMEEALSTLSRIKKLSSESRPDGADFFMEFDWGEDLDVIRMQVSEKVEQIKPDLPAQVGEVTILSFDTSTFPVVQGRISAQAVDLSSNYDLLEARVVNRLRRVPGVARVSLAGVAPKEIDIDLILSKIQEHNVDVGSMIRALQGASSNVVLGQVEDGGMRFTARAVAGFESLDEIRNVVINQQGLRLSDIAEITYEEPPVAHGRHLDLEYAVALEVYKESTANTVDVVTAVNSMLENEIASDPLLDGLEIFMWENQADQITNSLYGLTKAGAVGAILAVLSLYFFLRRFDSTIIVALSIPFSIVAATGVMYFMGKSLNVLSMMGLMLAVGMLVDNAVVVLESIDRTHRIEKDPKKAAFLGSRMVSTAVAASTTTTLIVFLPLIVGAKTDLTTWLKEIGIPISIALVCSLFSSLTLIPLMSAHFLRAKKTKPSKMISRLEDRYVRVLRWTLHHRVKTFALLVVAMAVGLAPFFTGMVESAIFSANINKRLFISYDFADFTYKSEAEDFVDEVEAFLDQHREEFMIDSLYSFYMENRAETTLVLTRWDMDDDEITALRTKIREQLPEIPGVQLMFDEDAQSGGSSTYFSVKFFGQDTSVMESYLVEAERRLETVEGVQDLRSSLSDASREVRVRVDRDKASRMGLTAQDVADVFAFTLGGMRLQRFNTGEREVETWLSLRIEDRENLADLKQLRFQSQSGRDVLLGDIATFEIVPRAHSINRENRKVQQAVRGVYEGADWETAQKEIEGLMNAFEFPPGYSWGWNDRIVEQQGQSAQMGVNFLLALLLVYLVMASLFESLAQPFAILFSIPFALPGAAWMMAATDTPFNLMGQIGLLILMGVVVNNGIVLLDYVNQLRNGGLSTEEAILRAGRERMRPILMTATTTIIGLLPLAVRGSYVGGLFYYPLARTVIGGLISSAVMTLIVLPFVNLGVEGVANWFKRLWTESGAKPKTPDVAPPVAEPQEA